MPRSVAVLWGSNELHSREHCTIGAHPGAAVIVGTAVLLLGNAPATIVYSVDTDTSWSTTEVTIKIQAGDLSRTLHLSRDGAGRWQVDGHHRPDLAPCTTVDLGWTPATNTLPLRAAALAQGESKSVTAAWVRFPELDVVASEQVYTQVEPGLVRYESATFTAVLEVSPDQIVARYGQGLWQAESYASH